MGKEDWSPEVIPKVFIIDPFDGAKFVSSTRRAVQVDVEHQSNSATPLEGRISPTEGRIFAPAGLRCGSLAVTRPPHKPRLASKRENEVKWVNNKFLWYKMISVFF